MVPAESAATGQSPQQPSPPGGAGTRIAALLALLVLTAPLAAVPTAAAATAQADDDPEVSVTNATATPSQPAPGQRTEIRTTIRNGPGSEAVEVTDVYIRRAGGSREYARAEDFGTLSPDGTLTVPLSATFSEPGVKDLRVYVRGEDSAGEPIELQYPLTVAVRDSGLQMDVDVTEPTVGSDRAVSVTVANGETTDFRNLDLTLEGATSTVENPRRLDAVLEAGTERVFDYDVAFPDTGTRSVTATLEYTTPNGDRRTLQDTAVADVTAGGVDLEVTATDPQVGGETPVAVTVSNGERTTLSELDLSVNGSNVRVGSPQRFTTELAAGANRTFDYAVTFPSRSQSTVTATLQYRTPDGERTAVRETTTVDLGGSDVPVERPQLEVTVADAVPGATRPVNVTVANGLENEVRQLRVVASSPAVDFEVRERVQSTMTAGNRTTFRYPASVAETGTYPVNVTLAYTDDGVRRQITREFAASFRAPPNPGEITLTDIGAVERGGALEISATASNVGSDDVGAVVVSTGGEQVAGVDYFVGEVDASDFASFTLSTTVEGNVSTVPVEVTYVVDGVEQSFTTDVPVRQAAPEEPAQGGGGGLPVVPIIALIVVLVMAVAVYRWRG